MYDKPKPLTLDFWGHRLAPEGALSDFDFTQKTREYLIE